MKARLSMAFEDLRGKDGNVVIAKGRTGLALRPFKRGRNPKTSAQTSVRGNFTKAASTWKTYPSSVVSAWASFALTITKTNPITGVTYNPTAFNEYMALACKFLQINPAGTIPNSPPAGAFIGDSLTILATAPATTGVIRFTASAANAANVKTEFLVQPLKTATRTPQAKNLRSKGFFAFVAGTLTKDIPLANGAYSVAYRFVNANTGQETAPFVLAGVLNVNGPALSKAPTQSVSAPKRLVAKKRKKAA